MTFGIFPISQYTWLFIMSINPIIFKLFKPKHFILFFLGFAASFINARAILPFMLLICLELDFDKLTDKDRKIMILFLFLQLFILFAFGSAWHDWNHKNNLHDRFVRFMGILAFHADFRNVWRGFQPANPYRGHGFVLRHKPNNTHKVLKFMLEMKSWQIRARWFIPLHLHQL